MAKTKLTLTDTHLVILSTTSARQGLNLLPLPDSLGQRDNHIEALLDDLVRHKLAAEQVSNCLFNNITDTASCTSNGQIED